MVLVLGHETVVRAKKGTVVLASTTEAVPQLQPLVYNGGASPPPQWR